MKLIKINGKKRTFRMMLSDVKFRDDVITCSDSTIVNKYVCEYTRNKRVMRN